jgi:hypothetical protein
LKIAGYGLVISRAQRLACVQFKISWRELGKERKMGIKEHDKRFGVTAVEKGFITLDQLFDAMKIQLTEEIEKREHRLLGTILFDMGVLSPPQIDEELDSMGKRKN